MDTRGDEVLEPARIEDGVRVFELTVSQIRWEILPGVTVDAYAYNGQIPGPRLQVTQGDRIRIDVTNELDESTTVHWHGLDVPNEMDGPVAGFGSKRSLGPLPSKRTPTSLIHNSRSKTPAAQTRDAKH